MTPCRRVGGQNNLGKQPPQDIGKHMDLLFMIIVLKNNLLSLASICNGNVMTVHFMIVIKIVYHSEY